MNEEISTYEDVIANIADLVGRLLKYHGAAFLPFFQPVVKYVLEFIKPNARIAERYIVYRSGGASVTVGR
jgi:Importin repeat 6